MPRQRREIQSQLSQLITNLGKRLRQIVKQSQGDLYARIADLLETMQISEGGQILRSTPNAQLQGAVSTTIELHQEGLLRKILPWIISGVRRLVGLNRDYYKSQVPNGQSVYQKAVNEVLLSLGYDSQNKGVISGSYLDNLRGGGIKQKVLARVSTAILARTPLKDFKTNFRRDFLGVGKLGLVETEFALLSRNLFSQVDRTAALVIAEETGMTHAIYAGTRKNNTRPFCLRRVNRIYTIEEIRSWQNQQWQGKITGAPVETALGGHNCRHQLRFLTTAVAVRLAKQRGQEINSYN